MALKGERDNKKNNILIKHQRCEHFCDGDRMAFTNQICLLAPAQK
jgi:hypothetical protein